MKLLRTIVRAVLIRNVVPTKVRGHGLDHAHCLRHHLVSTRTRTSTRCRAAIAAVRDVIRDVVDVITMATVTSTMTNFLTSVSKSHHSRRVSRRCNAHIKTAEKRTTTQQYRDATIAVDGWAVTFGTSRKEAAAPPSSLLAVPNVTTHRSTASVLTSYYSTWHYNCDWLCAPKG